MRLAARLLSLRCRRVLLTDLEWPGYLAILEGEGRRSGTHLVSLPLRRPVLEEGASAEDCHRLIVSAYRAGHCDGLFLSAVTYDGIRLPFAEVGATLAAGTRPRFVVIDGAQAAAHVPVALDDGCCDLFLWGCHKWLRARLPMGVAVCPRPGSRTFVRATLRQMAEQGELDDPVEAFTRSLDEGVVPAFSETVELSCLFAARAALSGRGGEGEGSHAARTENARRLLDAAAGTGWGALPVHESLRTGVVLLRAGGPDARACPPEMMRERLHRSGVAATCYASGLARLSMPREPLGAAGLDLIRAALRRCA
jgi:hypothetical protein